MPIQAHRSLTDRLKHLAAFAVLATLLLTGLCIPGAFAVPNDPWPLPSPPPDDDVQARECVQGTTLSYFYASPSTIEPEQNATLVWKVNVPSECWGLAVTLNGQTVNKAGSKTVQPVTTTTYSLKAVMLPASRTLGTTKVTVLLPPATELRYNEVRQKSTHNSYQRAEALLDQVIYHRIRSLELDIHIHKDGWSTAAGGEWYVFHENYQWPYPNDHTTFCTHLSDCLQELWAFHQANPLHEVVTVWFELKEDWGNGHEPIDLDNLIQDALPASALWTPAELMATCPAAGTMQEAVQTCGWPELRTLRNKFIFALLAGANDRLDHYASDGAAGHTRVAFIAPTPATAADLADRPDAIFFNLGEHSTTNWQGVAQEIYSADFVSRIYYANSATTWSTARNARVHHLATDKVNFLTDPWATTHNSQGWPFQCLAPCDGAEALAETGQVLGVQVNSEDIWGSSDHFRFLYEYTTTNGSSWTTAVSTPNSHVDDWAKGCLMARRSTSADSPYFAVCRPADDQKLRIQWRRTFGGSTERVEGDIMPPNSISETSISFIKLYVYNNNTCAAGYGSHV